MSLYCCIFKAYLPLLFIINILMAEFYRKLINVFWVTFENQNLFPFPPKYLRGNERNWLEENHPNYLKVFIKF